MTSSTHRLHIDPSSADHRRQRHSRPLISHVVISRPAVATSAAAALPRPHSASPATAAAGASAAAAAATMPEPVHRSVSASVAVRGETPVQACGTVKNSSGAIKDRRAKRLLPTRPASASENLRVDCFSRTRADRRRTSTATVAELHHRLYARDSSRTAVRKPSFDFRSQLLIDLALTQAPACRRLGDGRSQLGPSVLQPMLGGCEGEEENCDKPHRLWRGLRQQQLCAQEEQRRQSGAGLRFDDLPVECRLLVFSYLSQRQKGRCLSVCRTWYDELRAGQLWTRVNLDELPLCSGIGHGAALSKVVPSAVAVNGDGLRIGAGTAHGIDASRPAVGAGGSGCSLGDLTHCGWPCYARYQHRVSDYVSFLASIRPRVRSLTFSLDVGADGWCAVVERLLLGLDLSCLQHARVNWKETPARPFWLDSGDGSAIAVAGSRSSATATVISSAAASPSLESHFATSRVRQAVFSRLFELFVELAPSVRTLAMPFDWSPASVELLLQLRSLRCLSLDKYFVLQSLQPSLLARAVAGLPELRWLRLEIWTPPPAAVAAAAASRRAREAGSSGSSSKGDRAKAPAEAMLHVLANKTLEHLDIWACRGFYLRAVALPSLRSLRVRRYPWNGPLTTRDKFDVPCLGAVLAAGAPQLQRINELELSPACWHNWPPSDHGDASDGSVVSKTVEKLSEAGSTAAMAARRLFDLLRQVCSCHEHRRSAIL